MDWQSILVGFVVGIIGNLVTPIVRTLLATLVLRTISLTKLASDKVIRLRTKQIEEELARISQLRENVEVLSRFSAYHLFEGVMGLTVMVVFSLGLYFVGNVFPNLGPPTKFIIASLLGYGTRIVLVGLLAYADLNKVQRFDAYSTDAKAQLATLYGRLQSPTIER